MSVEGFEKYISKVRRHLKGRLGSGPRAVYIPPSIDQSVLLGILGLPGIDMRDAVYRYPSTMIDRLVERITGRDDILVANLHMLYRLYPRGREAYYRILERSGSILMIGEWELYREAVEKMGVRGDIIDEAGLAELGNPLGREVFLSEGSPTAALAIARGLDGYSPDPYMLRDSNERYILYYMTLYRGVGRLARILGPGVGMYINRLVRRGLLVKVGRRRGVYMVRDPLTRLYIWRRFIRSGDPEKYAGYTYLLRKALEGIVGGMRIPGYERDVHISEPIRFAYIDRLTMAVADSSGGKYLFRILTGEKAEKRLFESYPSMTGVGVDIGVVSNRHIRELARMGVRIVKYQDLALLLTRTAGFPRRL